MDIDTIGKAADVADKALNRLDGVLAWFNEPKEEARKYLVEAIKKDSMLSAQEASSLLVRSRKLAREYANSKEIYEKAKRSFEAPKSADVKIDDDWLHFFFDKAEKVSNESMQDIWARLLSGEFNKPGSISRKLLHIISIMDVHSARSFQTLCYYIFDRRGLFDYDYRVLILPEGFYKDCFEFSQKVEQWLTKAGYPDSRNLTVALTMTAGELNSLENLGLVHASQVAKTESDLYYFLDNMELAIISPPEGVGIEHGPYFLTPEGTTLYDILSNRGQKPVLEIMKNYWEANNLNPTYTMTLGSKGV